MSSINLRLPDSLHDQARKLAAREEISVDELIRLALAEKISALATEQYLGKRAARGSVKAFRNALKKVPAHKPAANDRIR